jgi:hypothetical protein
MPGRRSAACRLPAISVRSPAFDKLAHQPRRRSAVAAALYLRVDDTAFVIGGTPEIHPHTGRTTISSNCHRLLGRGRYPRSPLRAECGQGTGNFLHQWRNK